MDKALYNRGIRTIHAHWLSGEFPKAEFPTTKEKLIKLIHNGETPPLKVITPIREPMRRNISAFMFNVIKYGTSGRQETPQQLQQLFIEKYDIFYPQRWFDEELLSTFKEFNPFEVGFPYKKGYKIYKAGKNKHLIIRLEDADMVFSKAIKQLLGVRNVEMIHINKLEDKKYIGQKYLEMTKLKYPKEFVEKVYSQKYVQHFYTQDEIEKFKNKYV